MYCTAWGSLLLTTRTKLQTEAKDVQKRSVPLEKTKLSMDLNVFCAAVFVCLYRDVIDSSLRQQHHLEVSRY